MGNMLNLFAATRYINYAKNARLYPQKDGKTRKPAGKYWSPGRSKDVLI